MQVFSVAPAKPKARTDVTRSVLYMLNVRDWVSIDAVKCWDFRSNEAVRYWHCTGTSGWPVCEGGSVTVTLCAIVLTRRPRASGFQTL